MSATRTLPTNSGLSNPSSSGARRRAGLAALALLAALWAPATASAAERVVGTLETPADGERGISVVFSFSPEPVDGYTLHFVRDGVEQPALDAGLPQIASGLMAVFWCHVNRDAEYQVRMTSYVEDASGQRVHSALSNALTLEALPEPVPPVEEPPVEEEPPVVVEEPPLVIEEPPLVEEPPAVEEPPLVEAPPATTPGDFPSDPALVHWWRLGHDATRPGRDYGNSRTAIDAAAQATGISAGDVEHGADGSYVDFDGASERMQSRPHQQLGVSNRWSLAAWFRPDVLTRRMDVVHTEDSAAYPGDGMSIRVRGDEPGQPIHVVAHASSGRVLAEQRVPDRLRGGQWSHVVATWDGSHLRVFVDGEPGGAAVAGNPHAGTMTAGPRRVTIGGDLGSAHGFDGGVHSVALWNEPLSAEDIVGLYQDGFMDFDVNGRGAGVDPTPAPAPEEPVSDEPVELPVADAPAPGEDPLPDAPLPAGEALYAGPPALHWWRLGSLPAEPGFDDGHGSFAIDLAPLGTSGALQSAANQQLGVGNSWTVAMWVRPDRLDRGMDLMHTANPASLSDEIALAIAGDEPGAPLRVTLHGSSGRRMLDARYPVGFASGRWTHLVLRLDDGVLSVSADGRAVAPSASERNAFQAMYYGPRQITLGAAPDGARALDGEIQSVAVWREVLSSDDVADLAAGALDQPLD